VEEGEALAECFARFGTNGVFGDGAAQGDVAGVFALYAGSEDGANQ
jgi:hypothetical protein